MISLLLSVILFSILVFKFGTVSDDATLPGNNFLTLTVKGVFLVVSLVLLAKGVLDNAIAYGHWDAYWFWNYRAKFYTDSKLWDFHAMPTHGKDLFQDRVAHSDYPPGLSSAVAFFWKISHSNNMVFPFMINAVFSFCIPLLIFSELSRRHLLVSIIILFVFFLCNDSYFSFTSLLIADIWISFFLLAAFVCYNNYRDSHHNKDLFLTGLLLGGLIWSKNEGLLLTFLFLAFYAKDFFRKPQFKHLISGLCIPVALLVLFKVCYAPSGDLFITDKHKMLENLTNINRYKIIWTYFIQEINLHHTYCKWFFILYCICLIFSKNWLHKQILFIAVAIAVYFMIYTITPHDIDWHVSTSIDRIIWQFVPIFIYTITFSLLNTNKKATKHKFDGFQKRKKIN
jgi:hypothetical protein